MAYAPGTRVGYFANPAVLYAGVPTGVTDVADTAREMNERRAEVANFRHEFTPATLTLEATVPDSFEAGPQKGIVTVRRADGDDLSVALTVGYRTGGTAVGGVQYRALPGVVTLPAGATEARIKVKPLNDGVAGGDVTVKLTLLPGDGYNVGAPAKAKVKIHAAAP